MSTQRVADLVHRERWWKNRGLVALNLCLILPLITSYSNGYDGSMINGLQIVTWWQNYFHEPQSSILGMTIAAENVGTILALPFAAFISDKFGRRKALFTGALVMCAGVALQTISATIAQFIAARLIIGFGLCFATNSAPLLIVELAYPTQRAQLTASYNSAWYVGSIVAAWVTFGTFRMNTSWSWRLPSAIQSLPSILQVVLIWFTPESPRWLVSKGKDKEAIEILAKYHANGRILDPLVQYEYMEIRDALALEREASAQTSYMTLFSSKGMRRRMRIIIALGFFSQWSGNGLVSYYINLILTGIGVNSSALKTLINGSLQVFNLVMALGAALLVEKVGRRRLFLISNTGMFFAFAAWTIFTALFNTMDVKWAGKVVIGTIFLFFGFYDIAYSPLLVAYCVEILPFQVRAKGFAVMNFTIGVALIFNQYVNPVALDRLGWKYYLFYAGWLVLEWVVIYFWLYETRGRTLEQTAVLFDGPMNNPEQWDPFESGVLQESTMLSPLEQRRVDDELELKRRAIQRKPVTYEDPPMVDNLSYQLQPTTRPISTITEESEDFHVQTKLDPDRDYVYDGRPKGSY